MLDLCVQQGDKIKDQFEHLGLFFFGKLYPGVLKTSPKDKTSTYQNLSFGLSNLSVTKTSTLLGLQSRFGDNLGQSTWNLTGASPKRDWSSKRLWPLTDYTPDLEDNSPCGLDLDVSFCAVQKLKGALYLYITDTAQDTNMPHRSWRLCASQPAITWATVQVHHTDHTGYA